MSAPKPSALSRAQRWAVLAAVWGLARALFSRFGASSWGLDAEFTLDLALVPAFQAFAAGPFSRASRAGPVAVVLGLLVPLVPLHLLLTTGVAYLFGHIDLRPHVVAGILGIPVLQAGVLASLVPRSRAPAGGTTRRAAGPFTALVLVALLGGFVAERAFGWFRPALAVLLPTWPPVLRGLAGYGAVLALALGALLSLRARTAARLAAALLDSAAAALLAAGVGAAALFYQRPFLIPPWSVLLPGLVAFAAAASLAAVLVIGATAGRQKA